jgi:hypothetical protein
MDSRVENPLFPRIPARAVQMDVMQYEEQESLRVADVFRYAPQDFQGLDGRDGKQILGTVQVSAGQAQGVAIKCPSCGTPVFLETTIPGGGVCDRILSGLRHFPPPM